MEHVFTESQMEKDLGYARAVCVDGWIHVSGTAGMDYPTGEIPEDVGDQTRLMLKNLENALKELGSGFEDVVKRAIYIRDTADTRQIYDIIGQAMGGKCKPASQGFRTDFLHPKIKVEMTLVARRGCGKA
jgi:enamine deaminase RidA (YjgF/YER057c/UK114 family)